jgi:flagellar motility protein MotE (MotC chaperone)
MIRFIRDLRLIPVALIASACLLALKTADIVLDSPYFFAGNNAPPDDGDVSVVRSAPGAIAPFNSSDSWAKQMFNFPDGQGARPPSPQNLPQIAARRPDNRTNAGGDNLDITGSVNEPPASAAKPGAKADAPPDAKSDVASAAAKVPPGPPSGTVISTEGPAVPTGAERAILERLQQRREELDSRARELDLRESLIQSAQKRMDSRLGELKDVEAHIKVETQQKNEAESTLLKGLVTIYSNMKPRDAAKIFNGLDDTVLVEVSSKINPRTMAEILAQMQADVAQRLTVELASKAEQAPQPGAGSADLPKIDGQATPK